MDRMHGEQVGAGWVKRSDESKAKILAQLRTMVEVDRFLEPLPEELGMEKTRLKYFGDV